jgi:hypothetical protein
VAQQDERAGTALARRIDDECQVLQQRGVVGESPAIAAGGAVAALVMADDAPAGVIEPPGDGFVAADVFSQAVDDEHGASRRRSGVPARQVQREAIGGAQGLHGRAV